MAEAAKTSRQEKRKGGRRSTSVLSAGYGRCRPVLLVSVGLASGPPEPGASARVVSARPGGGAGTSTGMRSGADKAFVQRGRLSTGCALQATGSAGS
jgi:hypothetical protein